MPIRLTISRKVFGTAFLLVMLMAVAAAISTLLVRSVGFELTRVADTYVPLTKAVAAVDIHTLEQEILFERAVGLLRSAETAGEAEQLDAIMAEFARRGERVDTVIAEVLSLLNDATIADDYEQHRVELVRLEGLILSVEREHQDFQDLSRRVLEHLRQEDIKVADALLVGLYREEQEFDEQVLSVVETVSAFTHGATVSAVDHQFGVLRSNIIVTVLAALIALLLSALIARGLVKPLLAIIAAMREIEGGNLDAAVQVRTKDEVALAGELRIKEQIKDTFGKYVDPRIVENLIADEKDEVSTGDRAVYTVFFSDIAGFTRLSEALTPRAVVALMNAYLTAMSEPIRARKGIIDKYIGDAIMAFWGPPFTGPSAHARLACLAALEQLDRLADFQDQVPDLTGLRKDFPTIDIRIGIATGEVLVGNIGSDVTRNFTVMGDTVNLGARLESLNKQYGTRILISEDTARLARGHIETREIDFATVVGKTEPVRIYELLAPKGALPAERAHLRDTFESALAAYRACDWPTARRHFGACLEIDGGDPPAEVFLKRIERLERDAPPSDWSGIFEAQQK
jgi:adenylate cyclase